MELTLGPVLFEWKREELLRFYEEAACMDVDTVYLGEVVCAKKRGLALDDVMAVGERLEKAGKKAVVSSLAIVSNEEELSAVRALLRLPFPIEANDMSVFNMLDRLPGKEVFAGPHIASYNPPTIEFLKTLGVKRVAFPIELSGPSMAFNVKDTGVAAEVFAHGKAPLAFSWRCFTSRAHGLSKSDCRHDCARYPDGMELKTLGNEPVFSINGTSLLSAKTYTLIEFTDTLRRSGVSALRISPEREKTGKVVSVWKRRLDSAISLEEALAELKDIYPEGLCNGWYSAGAGKDYISGIGA